MLIFCFAWTDRKWYRNYMHCWRCSPPPLPLSRRRPVLLRRGFHRFSLDKSTKNKICDKRTTIVKHQKNNYYWWPLMCQRISLSFCFSLRKKWSPKLVGPTLAMFHWVLILTKQQQSSLSTTTTRTTTQPAPHWFLASSKSKRLNLKNCQN